jgi:hypothetical protein
LKFYSILQLRNGSITKLLNYEVDKYESHCENYPVSFLLDCLSDCTILWKSFAGTTYFFSNPCYAHDSCCRRLDSIGFHRALSSLTCILILIIVFALMLFILFAQVNSFMQDMPMIEQKLNTMIESLHTTLEQRFDIPVEEQKQVLQKQIRNFTESSSSYIGSIATGTAGIIVNAVFIFVICFLERKNIIIFSWI